MQAKFTLICLSIAFIGFYLYINKFHPPFILKLVADIPILNTLSVDIHRWFVQNDDHRQNDEEVLKPVEIKGKVERLFTVEQLKHYNGESGSKGLYLAILGQVFDVEKGKTHYGPGGSYNFFAGKFY